MDRTYERRVVDDELDALLPSLPALMIEGAKGVGKTATAERRSATIWQRDDPAKLAVATADPARLLTQDPPVLLDEWQRLPELWDHVRRAVDAGAGPGHYLLTGSAAPVELPAHSGAGRITTIRMRPMALSERGIASPTVSLTDLLTGSRSTIAGATTVDVAAYADEIVRSGFPGLRGLKDRALRAQLDGYLDRLADRDFLEIGHRVRSPQTLRRWMVAYAAAVASCATYETIRDAATSGHGEKPAKSTTQPYREALERLFLVDPISGWSPTRNRIARLATPPKHQLVDPALAARLLGVDAAALLEAADPGPAIPRDGSLLGSLFESLVALSVRVYAQHAEARVAHLRTKSGEHEIDLIIERADGRVVAIEIKLAASVSDHDVRHLHWLGRRIGDDLLDSIVITTGTEAYRRADGIAVIPAALLGP